MHYLLLGILGVGLLLRLAGITFGLPLDVMGDEFVHVYTALTFIDEMTLRATTTLSYVPSLFAILTIPFIALFGVVGMVTGIFNGVAGFKEFAILNATDFFVIGRIISALSGVMFLYVLYKIVRPLTNTWSALAVVGLAALDFWLVHESNKAHFWMPAVLLVACAFYALLCMAESGRLKYYWGAVVSIAAGVWMGFFPVILAPFFVLAHFHAHMRTKFTYLLYTSGTLAAAFVLIAWLNPLSILRQFGRAIRSTLDVFGFNVFPQFVGPSDNPTEPLQNLTFLLQTLFWDNPFLFVVGLGGLGYLAYRLGWRSFAPQLFIGFFVVYLAIAMFVWPHPDHRYVMPLLLPLLIGTAYALPRLHRIASRYVFGHKTMVVFVVVMLGYSAYITTSYAFLLLKPDTRILAREWIFANVPEDARVYTDVQYFVLPKSKEAIEFYSAKLPEALRTVDRTSFTLSEEKFPRPAYFVIDSQYAPKLGLEGSHYNYLVVGFRTPEERMSIPSGFDRVASFYPQQPDRPIDDLLLSPEHLIRAVGAVTHLGPHIEIYKRVE